MKPIYSRTFTTQPDHSFFVKYAEVPHTYNQFHYHKECELIYHIQNKGTRFIGDSIEPFNNGDLVLVGSKMPHYWLSNDEYFQNDDLNAKVVVVQFDSDFLSGPFLQLPEMNLINDLLERSGQGIQFLGTEGGLIGKKLIQLSALSGWKKMVLMIEILCMMSEAKNFRLLASKGFCEANRHDNEEKISHLFNYIINNHEKELTLEEISGVANMNPSAFCRYFKRSTSKTFSTVLNEIRVGFVCKALINTDHSISEIAYQCGFFNIPYFNRVFKRIKKITPHQYRNKHKVDLRE